MAQTTNSSYCGNDRNPCTFCTFRGQTMKVFFVFFKPTASKRIESKGHFKELKKHKKVFSDFRSLFRACMSLPVIQFPCFSDLSPVKAVDRGEAHGAQTPSPQRCTSWGQRCLLLLLNESNKNPETKQEDAACSPPANTKVCGLVLLGRQPLWRP